MRHLCWRCFAQLSAQRDTYCYEEASVNIIKKWSSLSLVLRIVIGLAIGAVLGIFGNMGMMPEAVGTVIGLLGDLFVGALKAVAPILVFVLVMSALANAKAGGSMSTIVVLYLLATFVAAVVAVCACYIFPLEITLQGAADTENVPPSGIGEVLMALVMKVVANPIDALANANYLGILAWAILIGMALRVAAPNTKTMLSNLSDAIATCVRWIISCAPFGILGLVYTAVATSGPQIFTEYGALVAVLVCCMLFIALVTNPIIAFACMRKNPYRLVLRCLKDSGITAFFTRSSAANIPVNMELCRKLSCGELRYMMQTQKKNGDASPLYEHLGGTSAEKLNKIGRARADGKSLSRTMQLLSGKKSDFLLVADSGPGETNATGLIVPKFGKNPENHVAVSMAFDAFSELLLLTQAHYNAWLTAWYMKKPETEGAFYAKSHGEQGRAEANVYAEPLEMF